MQMKGEPYKGRVHKNIAVPLECYRENTLLNKAMSYFFICMINRDDNIDTHLDTYYLGLFNIWCLTILSLVKSFTRKTFAHLIVAILKPYFCQIIHLSESKLSVHNNFKFE